MSAYDTREWRVVDEGSVRVDAVWSEDGREIRELVAVFRGNHPDALARAEQVVREHAMLSAPYVDEDHEGGHWLDVLPQRPRWADPECDPQGPGWRRGYADGVLASRAGITDPTIPEESQ